MNELFKALSDLTRRKILDLLKERDLTVGEIAKHFDLSQPSISQHLKVLKQAGLVVDMKKGQYVYYSLTTTVLQEIVGWVYRLSNKEEDEK